VMMMMIADVGEVKGFSSDFGLYSKFVGRLGGNGTANC